MNNAEPTSAFTGHEMAHLVEALVKGAALELYLTPKPGLVDLSDCGSHPDLTLAAMEHSIHSVSDYLLEMSRSIQAGERFEHQIAIAKRAERNLLLTLGTNTHKGFIFLSGIFLIASVHSFARGECALRETIAAFSRDFFNGRGATGTNGHRARARFRTGGIINEALHGFPALFNGALPAFKEAVARGACLNTASFAMLAQLMQHVEDTTTLHRGGSFALSRIRRDGKRLERILDEGGDHASFLQELNRLYVLKNITMGGVADMLALSYGYLIHRGKIIVNDGVLCIKGTGIRHLEDMAPLIKARPESSIWFGQPLNTGLLYEVPGGALRREALFEVLQSVCSQPW